MGWSVPFLEENTHGVASFASRARRDFALKVCIARAGSSDEHRRRFVACESEMRRIRGLGIERTLSEQPRLVVVGFGAVPKMPFSRHDRSEPIIAVGMCGDMSSCRDFELNSIRTCLGGIPRGSS